MNHFGSRYKTPSKSQSQGNASHATMAATAISEEHMAELCSLPQDNTAGTQPNDLEKSTIQRKGTHTDDATAAARRKN